MGYIPWCFAASAPGHVDFNHGIKEGPVLSWWRN